MLSPKPIVVPVAIALFIVTVGASANDVYLSIGGSVGVFRTDARIFNPSFTKNIQVQASLLPTGNSDNSSVQPKTITVGKRQMVVYDDVVASLFNTSGLAAIRLSSTDNLIATQRIYATVTDGTTGQFVPGLDASTAKRKGVLIQLKVTGSRGMKGTYRTNIGAVNPNVVSANVTWRVYDKNNALVGQPLTQSMPPFAVIGPTAMTAFGSNISGAADLTDAWVSYDSDQPVFAYASVVDNVTEDGTLIPMSEDTGVAPAPNYDGAWVGRTSQDQPISFTISNNAVRQLFLIFKAKEPCSNNPYRVESTYGPQQFPIVGNAFSVSDFVTVTGTLTSEIAANGTISKDSPLLGCTVVPLSWTASKQ